MFTSYLKVALRNMKRQKVYSLINVAGLAAGMACCILILLWVKDELSWDRFHEHADQLYRVVEEVRNPDGIEYRTRTTMPLGPALVSEIPEITHVNRSLLVSLLLEYEDKRFSDDAIDFADPDFFDMFSFSLLQGDPASALNDPHSIILTESMSSKYFGDENPMGKTMRLLDRHDLQVTGLMPDLPHNSHWRFDCLLPIQIWAEMGESMNSWEDFYNFTYVMLQENVDAGEINAKIAGMIQKHRPESRIRLFLQPFTDIHLHALEGGGNIRYVYIFSAIAIVVLLIACINFMNLTTARSVNRAREVGMRKVIGAFRRDLIRQFLGESTFLTLIALCFGIVLVFVLLPAFNQLCGKQLEIRIGGDSGILIGLLSIALFTGILSGSYPAVFLSRFQPVKVLKGVLRGGTKGVLFRRILVVTQFSLSIFLIIGGLVISGQLSFMQTTDLGFDLDYFAYVLPGEQVVDRYAEVREELVGHPGITNVGMTASLPGYIYPGTTDIDWDGKLPDHDVLMHDFPVGFDFIETMGMKIVDGRSFSRSFSTDTAGYILNETAVRTMDLGGESPVGMRFTLEGREGSIIGIVKDFHHGSFHEPIEPLVLSWSDRFILCLRYQPESLSGVVEFLKAKWEAWNVIYPFEISFLSDRYGEYYEKEEKMSALMNTATVLAILISCMGLFGLASFMVEQRKKEIGIRKVLGARVSEILLLLSKEYIRWILIANLIAWPAAWLVMNRWLQGFAYRMSIGFGIFLLAGMMTLLIASLTVGYQSVMAALANPVDTLRYE